jgi:hypothetical protein
MVESRKRTPQPSAGQMIRGLCCCCKEQTTKNIQSQIAKNENFCSFFSKVYTKHSVLHFKSSAQIDRCLFKGSVHADVLFLFPRFSLWTEISGWLTGIMLLCFSILFVHRTENSLFSLKSSF